MCAASDKRNVRKGVRLVLPPLRYAVSEFKRLDELVGLIQNVFLDVYLSEGVLPFRLFINRRACSSPSRFNADEIFGTDLDPDIWLEFDIWK